MRDTNVQHDAEQELIDRVSQEFAERCRTGQQPSIREYAQRYPALAEKLGELLPAVALIEQLKHKRDSGTRTVVEARLPERFGDYHIVREIGRGGMGIVYEARQESLDRRVALKILPRHSYFDPKRLARFRVEAQAAARLHHTNIVPVFGLFEHDGLFYYAMQYIEGQGLHQMIASLKSGVVKSGAKVPAGTTRNVPPITQPLVAVPQNTVSQASAPLDRPTPPPLPPSTRGEPTALRPVPVATGQQTPRHYWDQVANIGLLVAEALQYAHDQGILHRDIKPANLLLDGRGNVWVTDFGLAKVLDQNDLTSTGDVIGTLQYMAPECMHGVSGVRGDIYSLGLTLYELLTLSSPYEESTPARLLKLISERDPVAPRRRNASIPRDLETIVLKATSRDPNHRYPSASLLALDLRRFLEDRPISARRVATAERAWRWCRRNRIISGLAATALISLLLAGIVGWLGYATATRALTSESQRRKEAEVATRRAEANMRLSFDALQSIFATLAENQQLDPPNTPDSPPREPSAEREPPHDGGPLGPPPEKEAYDRALLQTVLKFYDSFAEQNTPDPSLKIEAAKAYVRVGDMYGRLDEAEKAAAAYERAAQFYGVLRRDFPDAPTHSAALAEVELKWATTAPVDAAARTARAESANALAVELMSAWPGEHQYRALGAHAQMTLAQLDEQAGQIKTARQHYDDALRLQRALVQGARPAPEALDHLYDMQRGLVNLLLTNQRPADARGVIETDLPTFESAGNGRRERILLAQQYDLLAQVLNVLDQKDEAAKLTAKAVDLRSPPRREFDSGRERGGPDDREPPHDGRHRGDGQRPDGQRGRPDEPRRGPPPDDEPQEANGPRAGHRPPPDEEFDGPESRRRPGHGPPRPGEPGFRGDPGRGPRPEGGPDGGPGGGPGRPGSRRPPRHLDGKHDALQQPKPLGADEPAPRAP